MKDKFIKLPNKRILNLDCVKEIWITHRFIKPNSNYEYDEYIIGLVINKEETYEMSFDNRAFGNTMQEYYECKKQLCEYLDVEDIDIIELR